jgi:hypothetical protein
MAPTLVRRSSGDDPIWEADLMPCVGDIPARHGSCRSSADMSAGSPRLWSGISARVPPSMRAAEAPA